MAQDPRSRRFASRSADALLAEARRFAADIRRRAERDASDIRRDAAEWAATTRREAEEYRDRLLAAIERQPDDAESDGLGLDDDVPDERLGEVDDAAPVVIDLRPAPRRPVAEPAVAALAAPEAAGPELRGLEPPLPAPADELPDDEPTVAAQRDFVATYLAEHRRRQRWRNSGIALLAILLVGAGVGFVVTNLPDDPGPDDDAIGSGTPAASSELVQLPAAVDGRPLAEVISELEAAGLSFRFTRVHDERVPAGAVVSMTGASAVTVPQSTVVSLLVSKGPAPRTIPDLQPGADADTAVAALEALGLRVERREVFHDDVPAGRLVAMSPEAGSSVERGATVTLTVSKGPDVVTVPDVVGRTLAEAAAQLTAAGLTTGAVHNADGGVVVDQRPDAGDEARREAPVNLRLGG